MDNRGIPSTIETTLESLRSANPRHPILDLTASDFLRYGRILNLDVSSIAVLADEITSIDSQANRYVASLPDLERHPSAEALKPFFGYADIQVGYCNGPNSRLNAVEWHKSSEIDVAVTDLVLILGNRDDIDEAGRVDSGALRIFFIPAGAVVELLPEVLHFSPCKVHPEGFKSLIILPRGTNEALPMENPTAQPIAEPSVPVPESRFLFMKNKWLIAHPERLPLIQRGAYPGIVGENIEIFTVE
ncbi:MAG: DUF4867 family protein [Rectinemataceae bacterium]|nr:DUF4867 family protein [Rectinemataceae bacterium]